MQEQDTYAWKVFHQQFEVRMPQAFAYLNPYNEARGVPKMTDKAYERELANTLVNTYRTLSQLIELADVGATIMFAKTDDVHVAYNLLEGFLNEWASRMEIHDVVSVPSEEEKQRLAEAYEDIRKVEEFIQLMIPAVIRTRPQQKLPEVVTRLHDLLGITDQHRTDAHYRQSAEIKSTPFDDRLSRGAAQRSRRWR